MAIILRFNDDIPGGFIEVVFDISWFGFLSWLLYAEVSVIRLELSVGRFKAAVRFLWYFFVAYCLIFTLEVVVLTLFLGLQTWK